MGAMVITTIDGGLEQLLRRLLPLPVDLGDVSFTAPERSWGAQLSRITVNLFLFDVNRSAQPSRAPAQRTRPDGQIERRPPLPLVQLSYLVTAWAGNTTDEHQLLGDVLRCLLSNPVLPPTDLPEPIEGSVQMSLADRGARSLGDLWSALDARPKPAFQLDVTAALDAPWGTTAAPVERIQSLVAPRGSTAGGSTADRTATPAGASDAHDTRDVRETVVRRHADGFLVADARPDTEA